MFAQFFVKRPVAAIVISLSTLLLGVLALMALPLSQYPDVVPPQVVITAFYPGQSANRVALEVAQPIEEQINGVENMIYMESQCTNDGAMRLTVTFEVGTDADKAQVLVQNRVGIAVPRLPEVTRNIGVVTKKQSSAILMVVSMFSETGPDGTAIHDQLTVSNFARTRVKDELARINGVGDVFMFGEREYSMRIWLDPNKMSDLGLTTGEVVSAIRSQNLTVAAGQIGAPPSPAGQNFQLVLNTQGRLPNEESFQQIVLKSMPGERLVRLKDVVSDDSSDGKRRGIELGARNYDTLATLNGRPSIGMPIFQLPGGNAFDTAEAIKAKMESIEAQFPKGLKYSIIFNPTSFVEESVGEVVRTLFEAVALVAIVVMLFLQNWRAALIPMLAIPVALIGTLAVMYVLGYSINNLTLFGMVLAIGIVVDDAIVVVEAVELKIAEGLSPLEATQRAMEEVSGAIIGASLVLVAVFGPATLIPGITGLFFKQFAITIAVATLLSLLNSLTLSPALCPLLLTSHHSKADIFQKLASLLIGKWFNPLFNGMSNAYGWSVGKMLRIVVLMLILYVGLLGLTGLGLSRLPSGFIPMQDQGYLVINVTLPDGASLERTERVMQRITDIALGPAKENGERDSEKGVRGITHITSIAGFSIFSQANISNSGGIYVSLAPFQDRKGLHADAILGELNRRLSEIQEAQVQAFGAPPILGLGNAGGFKMQIQDRGNYGLASLEGMTWNLVDQIYADASKNPGIVGAFSTFRSGAPQLDIVIDADRCFRMGISDADVKSALQVYLGSLYVNDLTLDNRNWQVNVQADAQYRTRVEDVLGLKVKAPTGEMVPLGGLVSIRTTDGPTKVNRFNLYPAADVNGFNIPFLISSGQAIQKMEQLAQRELPPGMTFEWADMAYQQKRASNTIIKIPGLFAFRGDTTLLVFALSTAFVYLVLAYLYESLLLPLAVILIVPMCLLASTAGLMYSGLDLNVFTQIGLVVLVGLASKNAILIVEFAKQQREAGVPRFEAAVTASKLRLRPILMTSFAFIFGVLPLVIAQGAGAEMRRALGTAVFSGMIGVTIFGLAFTPIFYSLVQMVRDGFAQRRQNQLQHNSQGHGSSPSVEPVFTMAPPGIPNSIDATLEKSTNEVTKGDMPKTDQTSPASMPAQGPGKLEPNPGKASPSDRKD
jgi:multidrug efflux pump